MIDDLHELIETYKAIIEKETGRPFPQDPREQLDLAVRAVFDSWNTDRARLYRRPEYNRAGHAEDCQRTKSGDTS